MRKFLDNCKKEVASAKKDGKTDESAAEPFLFPSYILLATWFLKKVCIFELGFILIQWNCIARSISIDDLGFRNIHKNLNSIVCKYDQRKKDKAGDKCTDKNLCANHKNPNICLFLALGLFFSLESVALGMKYFLFIEFGSSAGSAAKRFNSNLGKIIECYEEIASGYINASRGNSHGIRKGSSTYAASGTRH